MTAGATIYALSSGAPPAALAIIRISGPDAGVALTALAGKLPEPRRASLRNLGDPASTDILDRALVLWFPGPDTATDGFYLLQPLRSNPGGGTVEVYFLNTSSSKFTNLGMSCGMLI